MKYPEAKILNTSEEIINDKDVDLVVIPTPKASHHLLALLALQAVGYSGTTSATIPINLSYSRFMF